MLHGRYRSALLVLALAAAPALHVGAQTVDDPTEDRLLVTAGFLSAHPDLRFRLLGIEELKKQNHADALRFFQRAAFYGDKPSQGMIGEMFWNGQGTDPDPSLAYAWMDLAAERGYEGFLILRERYWQALTEQQRERAVNEGGALYAKYGDAATLPRIAGVLLRERRSVAGSRTGFAGNTKIYVPGPGGFEQIDATKFYDPKYWDPDKYLAWHDSLWMKPRVGRVTVGELENIQRNSPESRIPVVPPQIDAEEPATPERDESNLGSDEQ